MDDDWLYFYNRHHNESAISILKNPSPKIKYFITQQIVEKFTTFDKQIILMHAFTF